MRKAALRRRTVGARLITLIVGVCGLMAATAARAADPHRLALVIGNAHYQHAPVLENAANDANAVTALLKGMNFGVVDIVDADRADLQTALAAFMAKVHPGDTVLMFYAGHGVMGPVGSGSDEVDTYIVPTDARLSRADEIAPQSVGLEQVLQMLDTAHAGSRIIVVDACRDNPFAASWVPAPGQTVSGTGLVQPSSSRLQNVYIAFAAAPGQTASDNSSGSNGLFTQEVLKQLAVPGLTVNGVFERASAAVEHLSNGNQIPWFAAGGGDAANLVLLPSAGEPTRPADPMTLDLRLTREALACGLAICLESAAAEVRSATLRNALVVQASALRVSGQVAGSDRPVDGVVLPNDNDLSPTAAAFVKSHSGTLRGLVEIGDCWMSGHEDFRRDVNAAMRWYRAAGNAGSAEAAYIVATAYHHGIAAVPRNPNEARHWLLRAADGGYPPAFGLLGEYSANGLGGLPKSDTDAVAWFEQGRARSDPLSLRRLADMTFAGSGGIAKDPAQAQRLYLAAAQAGDPEAMMRVGYFILFSNNRPGTVLSGNERDAHAWVLKAAEFGNLQAYGAVSLDLHLGRGVPHDDAQALTWLLRGARRGSEASMYVIGMAYAKGDYGLAKDCHQASRWLHRAQVAGSYYALLELNSVAKACEAYY